MLNQFIVLKKPMGRLLTSFHPPLRSSSLVISPSIVHIRGITIRSSGLFHPLRVALPKPINSIKTTSSSQLKDDDKEDSDPDDEDEPIISTSGKLHGAEKCIYHKREDDVVVYLTCEMPGLDEEDVFRVMPEKNMLVVKGKKRQETCDDDDEEEEEEGWKYCSKIKFEPELFKINEIKAEMKNGWLKVVLPKLKGKERKDRIHVSKVNTVWSFLLFCGRIVFWIILSVVFTGIMCFLFSLFLFLYHMWYQT